MIGHALKDTTDIREHMEEIRICLRGHNLYDIDVYKRQVLQSVLQRKTDVSGILWNAGSPQDVFFH